MCRLNYYERHLGDYAKRTTTLTMAQHGAYNLLLDYYYVTEQPIPEDEVYSVAKAVTKPERDAVDKVLEKYFDLIDGAWRHQRCEEVIAAYVALEPKRVAKRKNANDRQNRARERRAKLFDSLREVGIVPPYKTTTEELDALLSRHLSRVTKTAVTRDVTASNLQSQSPLRGKTSESDSESTPSNPHTLARTQASDARARECVDNFSAETDNTRTLITAGLDPSHADEHLVAWQEEGFSTERLLKAIAIAKKRKRTNTVPAKYVDLVVRDDGNFPLTRRAKAVNGTNGTNGNGVHHDTADELEDRVIEDAIRRGLTDAEIIRIPDLQVAPNLHVRITAKREELTHAEH